jgi:hypothetical protein
MAGTEEGMSDSMIERVARALAPLAWAALGLADTLAHKNRRAASLRHARAAIEAMRVDVANYDAQITGERADGRYYSVEEGVFDDGRETALGDILAMIDAALSENP